MKGDPHKREREREMRQFTFSCIDPNFHNSCIDPPIYLLAWTLPSIMPSFACTFPFIMPSLTNPLALSSFLCLFHSIRDRATCNMACQPGDFRRHFIFFRDV